MQFKPNQYAAKTYIFVLYHLIIITIINAIVKVTTLRY